MSSSKTTPTDDDETSNPSESLSDWPGLCLDHPVVSDHPFRYATLSRCLSPEVGEEVLRWMEESAPWRLKQTDFYEQHEFSCWDSGAPVATYLTRRDVLQAVHDTMGRIFRRTFAEQVSVVCHRLLSPQRIGVHNDYLAGEETHRLVIQLNRGMSDADGGILMLFNSDDPADIHRLLRPVNLSGLAFEISARSHHAVSQVHGGARYTIIYSLTTIPQLSDTA